MEKKSEECFGRCHGCGRMRWISHSHAIKYGVECKYCGSVLLRAWTDGQKMSILERLFIVRWFVWEHMQRFPQWNPLMHPIQLLQGVKIALKAGGANNA